MHYQCDNTVPLKIIFKKRVGIHSWTYKASTKNLKFGETGKEVIKFACKINNRNSHSVPNTVLTLAAYYYLTVLENSVPELGWGNLDNAWTTWVQTAG